MIFSGNFDYPRWYDITGQRIRDSAEIERLLGSVAERRVAITYIEVEGHPEPAWISTVFLVLDHSLFEGPPQLWETMPFGGPLDQEAHRHFSLDDAIVGHEHIVTLMLMELDATDIRVTRVWGEVGKAALGKHPTVQWNEPQTHENAAVCYSMNGEQ